VQQYLKFDVFDYDSPTKSDFIGSCQTTISKIMGSKNQMCILDLKNHKDKYSGKIIIKAEQVAFYLHTNPLYFFVILNYIFIAAHHYIN